MKFVTNALDRGQPRTFTPNRNDEPAQLFDIPCPGQSDGNPVCACQISCPKGSAPCEKAKNICKSKPDCIDFDVNPDKSWATLKRGPSDEEMRIFEWEGMSYSMSDVRAKFGSVDGSSLGRGDKKLADVMEMAELADGGGADVKSDRSPLCFGGGGAAAGQEYKNQNPATPEELKDKTLGIVGLSYQTPGTLLNSMLSWESSGLLDVSSERLLLLNDPHPGEVALGLDYDFRVVQPKVSYSVGRGAMGEQTEQCGASVV